MDLCSDSDIPTIDSVCLAVTPNRFSKFTKTLNKIKVSFTLFIVYKVNLLLLRPTIQTRIVTMAHYDPTPFVTAMIVNSQFSAQVF